MDTVSLGEQPFAALAAAAEQDDSLMMITGCYPIGEDIDPSFGNIDHTTTQLENGPQEHLSNTRSDTVPTTPLPLIIPFPGYLHDNPMLMNSSSNGDGEEYNQQEEYHGIALSNIGGENDDYFNAAIPEKSSEKPIEVENKKARAKSSSKAEYRIVTFVEKHTGRKKSVKIKKTELLQKRDEAQGDDNLVTREISSSGSLTLLKNVNTIDSSHNATSPPGECFSHPADLDAVPRAPTTSDEIFPISDVMWTPVMNDIIDSVGELTTTNNDDTNSQEPLQEMTSIPPQQLPSTSSPQPVEQPPPPPSQVNIDDVVEPSAVVDEASSSDSINLLSSTLTTASSIEDTMEDTVNNLNDLLINDSMENNNIDDVFGEGSCTKHHQQLVQQQLDIETPSELLENFTSYDTEHYGSSGVSGALTGCEEPSNTIMPLQVAPPLLQDCTDTLTAIPDDNISMREPTPFGDLPAEELKIFCERLSNEDAFTSNPRGNLGYLSSSSLDPSSLMDWSSPFLLETMHNSTGEYSDFQVDYEPDCTLDITANNGQELITENFPTHTFDVGNTYYPGGFDPTIFMNNQNIMIHGMNNESMNITDPQQYNMTDTKSSSNTWSSTRVTENSEQTKTTVRRVKKNSVKNTTSTTNKRARNSKRSMKGDTRDSSMRKENSMSSSKASQQHQYQSENNNTTIKGRKRSSRMLCQNYNGTTSDPFEIPEAYAMMIQEPLESLRLLAYRIKNKSRLM